MKIKELVINRVILDMHTHGYLRKPTQEMVTKEQKDNGFHDIFMKSCEELKNGQKT